MAIQQVHIPEMTLTKNDLALLYEKVQSIKTVDKVLRLLVEIGKAKEAA